jgi:hypothetical protein
MLPRAPIGVLIVTKISETWLLRWDSNLPQSICEKQDYPLGFSLRYVSDAPTNIASLSYGNYSVCSEQQGPMKICLYYIAARLSAMAGMVSFFSLRKTDNVAHSGRAVGHEVSSPSQTLGTWFRIPLEAVISALILCLRFPLQVSALRSDNCSFMDSYRLAIS